MDIKQILDQIDELSYIALERLLSTKNKERT